MIHFRFCSDIHLEFHENFFDGYGPAGDAQKFIRQLIPNLPTDKKTVLIVAGDLGSGYSPTRIAFFFEYLVKRFFHIFYVLGNHEHYGTIYPEALARIQLAVNTRLGDKSKKVTIVGDDPTSITLNGAKFIGATTWTDYAVNASRRDEIRERISYSIADHSRIYNLAGGCMMPADFALIYETTVNKIEELLKNSESNDRTVVVTHHLPSFTAVHPMYMMDERSRILNHAFASNLEGLMIKYKPAYWVFGHTHTSYYGEVGQTKLLCNPYGYPHESVAKSGYYDTTKVITV